MQRQPLPPSAIEGIVACWMIGMGIFAFCALATGNAPAEATPLLCAWLGIAGITAAVCGIISMIKGDLMNGAPAVIFGAGIQVGYSIDVAIRTWALKAGIGTLPMQIDGWVWLAFAIIVAMLLPGLLRAPWSLFAIVVWVDISLWLGFLDMIFGISTGKLGPWMILAFGVYMLYVGFVGYTNVIYGKPVLPLGRPIKI